MVEINNQRKASSICWRGRRELDNGRRENQKSWQDVTVGGAIY